MKHLNNILRKLSAVVLVLSLVIQIPATSAQFSDIEESKDNLFEATKLDLELSSTGSYTPVTIIPGETSTRTITFTNAGEIPFAYNQIYVEPSLDSLCSQLNLKVYRLDLVVPLIYNGLLKNLNYQSSDTLAVGTSRDYIYELTLPIDADETLTSLTCSFDIVSYAWQEELGIWRVGFWDVENIGNVLGSGTWEVCMDGDKTWAVSVEKTLKPGGEPYVQGARYNEEKVLGEPDGDFYSMGSGASISVEMENPVDDRVGNDLSVHLYLAERDNYNVETGSVEISADNINWFTVGQLRNDEVLFEDPQHLDWGVIYFDISHTGLSWFKYVKVVDTPDIESLDNNSGGFDVDAIDGVYGLCDEPSIPVCNTIFGSKKDESGAGLADWEIVIHPTTQEIYQSLTINANDPDGEDSIVLESDRKYLIEASGVWTNGTQYVDTNYYSDVEDWSGTIKNYDDTSSDPKQLDLVIDNLDVYWNGHNSDHLYKYIMEGDGNTHNVKIFETDENDANNEEYTGNTGALQVRIFDITNQIVKTDATGVYSRFVCGGPYQVLEVAQNGWEQITPETGYYHVDLSNPNSQGYDFVNKKVPFVIINEIMWMGSSESTADEWIELRNMTNRDIDISGWKIYGAVSGSGGHLQIPNTGNCRFGLCVIPANGYFLIANKYEDDSNSALNVVVDLRATEINFNNNYTSNGQIILKDTGDNLMDSTPIPTGSAWPLGFHQTGDNETHKSMERNSNPDDGTIVSNWHTCIDDVCNDGTYWDTADGVNYGTPKNENHSDPIIALPNVEVIENIVNLENPQPDNAVITTEVIDLVNPLPANSEQENTNNEDTEIPDVKSEDTVEDPVVQDTNIEPDPTPEPEIENVNETETEESTSSSTEETVVIEVPVELSSE